MPKFDVSLDESVAILKQVLPLMSQQRVPTIPQNYAVWYDYVSSPNGELRSEIQRHLERENDFSPELCRQIYEKYFLDEIRAEVDGVQTAVREAVETAITELGALGEDISRFSDVLDSCGAKLKEDLTQEDLSRLVVKLARETTNTRERSAQVEASLQVMSDELTELRSQVNALTRDSQTDALTGISNRRAFDAAMERLTQESEQDGQPLSLIMADIDHFKAFNDSHGHLVGDQVLRFVAQEMQQCVKGRDVLARFGGEEFSVLLPATPLEGARMLAESIRVIIESQVVSNHSGKELDSVTISMGVAQFLPGEDAQSFITRADACLYKSKAGGRNRVTAESELATH
jgi:diguanylate cyclase